MSRVARGSFKVEIAPNREPNTAEGVTLGRLSLDKTFEGDLVGVGRGEMLTAMTPVKGSAGYVAIERVSGTLGGVEGSFVLQHSGTMDRGAQGLSVAIVPDSGTGGLRGIRGTFLLSVVDGEHRYELTYDLPDSDAGR